MNRVLYILDASGSMRNRVGKTIALTLASISKLNPEDRVSILTFEENTVVTVCHNVPAKNVVFKKSDYKTGGGTNLLDAVHDGCQLVKTRYKNDTYFVVVITDGGENCSKRCSKAQLAAELAVLQKTDHWTQAWMVPPECVEETKRLGIDETNILPWTDIEFAAKSLAQGQDNLAVARTQGKTALTSGFFTDLSKVSKADIRAQMELLDPQSYRTDTVTRKERIDGYCKRHFGEFTKGAAYYELTETEIVQPRKQILVIDKRRPNEVFSGGRNILGLPSSGNVRVKPGDHGNYRIFVMSTSDNRNTDPNTTIIYRNVVDKVLA